MTNHKLYSFSASIDIIGINPFVFVPQEILQEIFKQADTEKGPIPIKGTINAKEYKQTLVKYSGQYRLYINTAMLKNSPKRIGETVEIGVVFDPENREIEAPPSFIKALEENTIAKSTFDGLIASRKSEIIRYLASLKTQESLKKNIKRAINFLLGNERFIGRDKP